MTAWPFLLVAYQIDLALACLDAFELAPALPRFEPEVDPVMRARRHSGTNAPVQVNAHIDQGGDAEPMQAKHVAILIALTATMATKGQADPEGRGGVRRILDPPSRTLAR